jgi:cytochrome c peroxidase
MGFPDIACIAFRLSQATYRTLFELVWGDSFDISWPSDTEDICNTPAGAAQFGGSATPIGLSSKDRALATNIYDNWAQSISFYERSPAVSAFTSKFDAAQCASDPFIECPAGHTYKMTPDEAAGYKLFNGKARCNQCHVDGVSTQLPGQTDQGAPTDIRPLFTGFFYANIGVPLNPRVSLFYETAPDNFGFTPNPDGFGFRDLGFGTFLRSGTAPNPNSQWLSQAPANDGLQQTSSLRDVALVPPQCPTTEAPGPYFQKEFYHNGYAKSLKQVVHFYNTRDVYAYKVTSGHCPAGTVEKVTCWPMPEVENNVNMVIGNLGLTDQEEDQIVAFLLTLNDGFTEPYPDIDTFTGKCMTGGDASTQGNEMLIPTPTLPPCASDVCGVPPLPIPPIE